MADITKMTDEELMSLYNQGSDIQSMSNEELMRIYQSSQPQQPVQEQGFLQNLAGDVVAAQKGLSDTLTFGFGDEIKAGIQGAVRGVLDPNVSREQATEFFLNKARQDAAQAQEQSPYAYGAGQVAGAIGVPLGGAALAPQAARGIANVMQRGALPAAATAFGLGATQGGLYGYGSGEGSAGQRGEQAFYSGAVGGAGGLAGLGVGSLASKAAKVIGKKFGSKGGQQVAQTGAGGQVVQDISDEGRKIALNQERGEVFSQTAGQRGQQQATQRMESEAMAGLYGDRPQTVMNQVRNSQSRERKAFISQLGDIDKVENVNDLVDNVYNTIQSQAKSLKGQVNNAYALAREGKGTKISVNDIKDGLFKNIAELKREGAYDLNAMPVAQARVKDLTRLMRSSQGTRFTSANLGAMENFRTRISKGIASTQDATEKNFLRGMLNTYDDFMYRTANEAVDAGDSEAINAFKDAVSKRREYGMLYETDKFVNDIVSGKKGLDDTVKDLIGTGSIVGKKRMENTYDALIKAAASEADAVQSDLKTAFAKKILEQSISGLEEGGENAFLSAAKTQSALKGLFQNNRSFARKLYGDDVLQQVDQAISELEKIKSLQPSVSNPSGSGEMVLRALNRVPMLNFIGQGFDVAKKQSMASKVGKSVKEVLDEVQLPTQSTLFKPVGAASGGGVAARGEE